jgi:hypothetical protein
MTTLIERLKKVGNQTVTNCHGLRMKARDGKLRITDVVTAEQLLWQLGREGAVHDRK